ncbi:MAG: hypothetical protein GY714_15130 [Desulfobacterales bacterium]|nr:hypothetical protein [Desulfobacterales bacterium]
MTDIKKEKIQVDIAEKLEEIDKKYTITSEGLNIDLSLSPDTELQSANFEIVFGAKKEQVNSLISCIKGETTCPVNDINWILADFGQNKLIDTLNLSTQISGEKNLKLRIKIFSNNAWTTLMPMDLFSITSPDLKISFSPVLASKFMIEFVKESKTTSGLWEPAMVSVDKIMLFSSPSDLKILIDQKELFNHEGIILAEEKFGVEEFVSVANEYLFKNPEARLIPLKLICGTLADISIKISGISLSKIVRKFTNDESRADLKMEYGEKRSLKIDIGEQSVVKEVKFEYTADLSNEQILLDFSEGQSSIALLCDSKHSAAQSFNIGSEKDDLTGIDLYLRVAKAPAKATLSIHMDELNSPSVNPLPETTMNFEFDKPEASEWFPFRLDGSVSEIKKMWAVLLVSKGALHWHLTDKTKTKEKAMVQIKAHPWQPRESFTGVMRNIGKSSIPPDARFRLTRGGESIELNTEGGLVTTLDNLTDLNNDSTGMLELNVESNGKGRIIISNLKIRIDDK